MIEGLLSCLRDRPWLSNLSAGVFLLDFSMPIPSGSGFTSKRLARELSADEVGPSSSFLRRLCAWSERHGFAVESSSKVLNTTAGATSDGGIKPSDGVAKGYGHGLS